MIEAVIFDFDGLIIDTESAWSSAYTEVLEQRGISLPADVLLRIIGAHNDALDEYLQQTFGNDDTIRTIHGQARVRFGELMGTPVMREGVAEYLQEAKSMGLKIGLASSSQREWIESYFRIFRIGDYFGAIVTADDVERVKPHPDLYVRAMRLLDAEPHRSLAFEDSPNGLIAARTAGMHCVIVPNAVTRHMPFRDYSMRLSSMADMGLREVIQKIADQHGSG